MKLDLAGLIGQFPWTRVLVAGEAMLDVYWRGRTKSLCREAPVPVISVTDRTHAPGGAANTAVNVAALGGQVTFLSVAGTDAEGALLRRLLEAYSIASAEVLPDPGRGTLSKHRVMAGAQMLVRFDHGTTDVLGDETERRVIGRLRGLFREHDAVIVSDYGYGFFTPAVIEALAELQAATPRILVVDAKEPERYSSAGITAVKPNYAEAARMLGLGRLDGLNERAGQISAHAEQVLDTTGANIAAVTLDEEGAVVFERGRPPYRTYARPHPHSRAQGAGDTFVSAFALSLAAGAGAPSAAEAASAAAGIVVAREGTVACSASDLSGYFSARDKRVRDRAALESLSAFYHRMGRRIVFTNGCFDILHRGHITYLSQAKALGDVLIVGVNADESVRRLKGPERPINALDDRLQVLEALSCIDHVVGFPEDTTHRLIRALRPDVYVKGGDYSKDTLPEAALVEELGGTLEFLPYLKERSTSGIIERVLHARGTQPRRRSRKQEPRLITASRQEELP